MSCCCRRPGTVSHELHGAWKHSVLLWTQCEPGIVVNRLAGRGARAAIALERRAAPLQLGGVGRWTARTQPKVR
jgi:hypothetical protein